MQNVPVDEILLVQHFKNLHNLCHDKPMEPPAMLSESVMLEVHAERGGNTLDLPGRQSGMPILRFVHHAEEIALATLH